MPRFCFRDGVLLALLLLSSMAAGPIESTVAQRWAMPIDSRNVGQWLSVRGGIVYSVKDAHVVAIELTTGRIRWTSKATVDSRPAIGGRTIYAPIVHGVVAIDAATGNELGRQRLAQTPTIVTTDSAAVAIVNTASRSRLIGFRDTLKPRWERDIAGEWDQTDDVGHDTVLVWAARSVPSVIALDAGNGNVMAATDGVEDYVGRDRQTLWFSVADGGLKSLSLDTNRSIAIHNRIVRGAVRVEGRTAVAVIDGRLTTLSLPAGRETPFAVNGRWIGGPANGTIFISRQDGTYAQRLDGGKAIRIVTNTSDARFLTATGRTAYFATNDGAIVMADLVHMRPVKRLATACRFVEGIRVVDRAALVHCDDNRSTSHLYAFGISTAGDDRQIRPVR